MTVLLLFCAQHSGAQDTLSADSVKKLNEITITATRSDKNIFDVGRSITVIGNRDLKNGQYNNLADVLSQQEGISMIGTGQNFGGTQSVFIRGANSNQNVILIDGVRITDPSAPNNAPDLSEFSLTNIDKIEIVRGSHSTLYGSSAIGGVINILTRKDMSPGFHADAMAMGGVFGKGALVNGQDLFLNYTGKSGFYIDGEVNNFSSGGQDATVDTVTNPNTYNKRDKDGFSRIDYVVKGGYHHGKVDAYLGYRKTKMITDIDKGAFLDDDNYSLDFGRNLVTYGATYKYSDSLTFSLIGGYSDMTRHARNDSSVVDTAGNYDHSYYDATYRGTHSTTELQLNWTRRGFDLVAGGGLYAETMSQDQFIYLNSPFFGVYQSKTSLDSLDLQSKTYNAFLHMDMDGSVIDDKLENIQLALGCRYTDNSVFGNHFTYEICPSYKLDQHALLFASYSTGYNAPSLYQLYAPDRYYTDTSITLGNKNLKPESSSTIEVGFKQKVNEKLSFSVAVFATEVNNLIEFVNLWDKNQPVDSLQVFPRDDFRNSTYVNVGTSKTKGVEMGLFAKPNDKIIISANISLVSGRLFYDASGVDTSHTHGNHIQLYNSGAFLQDKSVEIVGLSRRPSTANVSLTYLPIKSLMLRADLRYVGVKGDIYYDSNLGPNGALGTTPVGDYMLLDLSMRYFFSKNISAGIKAENIFNTNYYEIMGFTTRGRGVYFSLRASF